MGSKTSRDSFRVRSSEGESKETAGSGRDPTTSTTNTTTVAPENDKKESTVGSGDSSSPEQKPQDPQKPPPPDVPPQAWTAQFQSFNVSDLLGPEKVDLDDVKNFREKLCGYQTFFVTGQEPFGEAGEGILLLGNMRGRKEAIFAKLRAGMALLFGEKYELFMVEEPRRFDTDEGLSGGGGGAGEPRVSFVLVRKVAVNAPPIGAWQYALALVLFAVTSGACLELGLATQISKVPPEVIKYFTAPVPEGDPPTLETLAPFVQGALPVAYGVLGIQAFHELGHFLMARQRKVKLGVPFLIPNITIGSFGSITQFRGPCPDRTAKFDVSVAGPIAGATLSLAMFAAGLALTTAATAAPGTGDLGPAIQGLLQEELVKVPSLLFQGSLLLGLLSRAALGYDALHAGTVAIHPLLITGWCGLTVSALNLLPAGNLDGGRAMQAAFGRTPTVWASSATYIMLGLGLIGGTLSLPFGLYVLLLQRNLEKPALNDVTEVSRWRKALMGGLLAFSVLTLLPVFEDVAETAGIGLDTLGTIM